jgi:hypothetical protein
MHFPLITHFYLLGLVHKLVRGASVATDILGNTKVLFLLSFPSRNESSVADGFTISATDLFEHLAI